MRRLTAVFLSLLALLAATALADAQENQATVYTYLTENMGLTRAAACGVLSNIRSESGFRPDAVGDSGNAYGICQWNSRRQSLVNFCEEHGYEDWTSLEGQLGYLEYELKNNKKSVGEYLKKIPDTAQGAYDAAWYFCVYYEIPASRYDKGVTRGKYAVNTYFKQYGGSVSSYTVTYDANGGTKAPSAGTKTEGVPYTVTDAAPVRAGYTLAGWSEEKNAKKVEYAPGDSYTENKNVKLYAVWERSADADTPAERTASLGGHTYEFYSGSFTWARAQEFAAVKGGYLASVRTESEQKTVAGLTASASGPCWLGGEYKSGNWVWTGGESFSDSFASSHWAEGEPCASEGPNERGKLAISPNGQWLDLPQGSLDAGGLVIEYGEKEVENAPVYLITVSSSLRLREGPGTGFDTLSYLIPGMFITISETKTVGSTVWGWGVTDDGASGWCAVKIPDYMTPVDWVDEKTGLVAKAINGGVQIAGLSRESSSVVIPEKINGMTVTSIAKGAFTGKNQPTLVEVPECVTEIAKGAFEAPTKVKGFVASAAHFAAAQDGCAFLMLLPEDAVKPAGDVAVIEADAFRNDDSIAVADLRFAPLTTIETGAFCDCVSLKAVLLPDSVSSIADGAFDKSVVLVCSPTSYAARWAEARSIRTVAPGE